jgi:hypothetical protein
VKWKILALLLTLSALDSWSQGTIYLSNLGESGAGYSVGGGSQSFATGLSSNGFVLNSVTLVMGAMLDNASNFTVSIFDDNAGTPGNLLSLLNGNNDPRTAGEYAYTSSGLILASSTTYWIVASCDSSSPNPPIMPPGGYTWQETLSQNILAGGGWSAGIGNTGFTGATFQFAVNATPVPEPSACALLGVAVILFLSRK